MIQEEKEIGNKSLEGRKERFGLTPRKENTKRDGRKRVIFGLCSKKKETKVLAKRKMQIRHKGCRNKENMRRK